MTYCPNCELEVHPAHDMTETGAVIETCSKCACKLTPGAKAPAVASVNIAAFQSTDGDFAKAFERVEVAAKRLAVTSDADAIADHLRARLAAVEVEIERAKGLQGEARKLRRMLRAAETKR